MICKRCLNDNSVRNITFDSDGVCCFCRGYERIAEKLSDRRALQTLFEKRMLLCQDVARYKQAHHMQVFQADREKQVLDRVENFIERQKAEKKEKETF